MEAAFARERTFVADASHELRTPLAILKTELELALRRGRTPEELTEALRSAAEETDRLVALAEDLLVIARSDQGRLPIRRRGAARRPSCSSGSATAARPARAIAPRRRRPRRPGRPAAARAGARQPARQRAPPRRRATIELAAEPRDGAVAPPRPRRRPRLPRRTSPPSSASPARDSARGRGGAGLGLAIVAAIARAHGGDAGAANRAGRRRRRLDRAAGRAVLVIALDRRRPCSARRAGRRPGSPSGLRDLDLVGGAVLAVALRLVHLAAAGGVAARPSRRGRACCRSARSRRRRRRSAPASAAPPSAAAASDGDRDEDLLELLHAADRVARGSDETAVRPCAS